MVNHPLRREAGDRSAEVNVTGRPETKRLPRSRFGCFRSGAARWLEIRPAGKNGGYVLPIDGEAEKRAGKDDLKTWKR
jgi:hypothetical protein